MSSILSGQRIRLWDNMGKSLKLILASALCMLVSTACGGNSKKEIAANEQTTTSVKTVMAKDGKALVVFFSHAGDNYAVGNIEVGNTKIVADYITELTGAEQFEIVTHKYDGMAYNPLIKLAQEEARNGELPEYEGDIDLSKYDTVFIGFPIWCSDMPMIIYSFLEKHVFTGKIVVPFCTHGGSGEVDTFRTVAEKAVGSAPEQGLAMPGDLARQAGGDKQVSYWIDQLAI